MPCLLPDTLKFGDFYWTANKIVLSKDLRTRKTASIAYKAARKGSR